MLSQIEILQSIHIQLDLLDRGLKQKEKKKKIQVRAEATI